jgi:putative ABC transport system permease protein
MAHMRESYLRQGMAPLLIGAVIAGFMMLMVGLGLTGVLWQNVTQRTREIGLRRATGATGADVQRQVLGEILILATLGMGVGILVVVQLPLLDLLGGFRGTSFGAALAGSAALLYALSALCAFYPGRLATRITPVEALHHD